MTRSTSRRNVMPILELLAERFPACFSVYENRRRPLAVGIHAEILVALDGALAAADLGLALRVYTSNAVYRSKLRAGAVRIGLDGEPAGVVTPEQQVPPKIERKSQPAINKQKTQEPPPKPAPPKKGFRSPICEQLHKRARRRSSHENHSTS
jgi:ProP effector